MRSFRLLTTVCLLFFGLLTGCDSFPGVEQDDAEIDLSNATSTTVNGLGVHLFAPDTVAVADSFAVQVAVSNPSNRDRTVTTPSACLVRPSVFSATERVPLKGSMLLCAAAITTHHIPAGELVKRRFDLQAVLDTSEGELPASPGPYTVRATLNWTLDGRSIERSVQKKIVLHQ